MDETEDFQRDQAEGSHLNSPDEHPILSFLTKQAFSHFQENNRENNYIA